MCLSSLPPSVCMILFLLGSLLSTLVAQFTVGAWPVTEGLRKVEELKSTQMAAVTLFSPLRRMHCHRMSSVHCDA